MAPKVDGDQLAEGLRRVVPFMKSGDPVLFSVYAESHDGKLELTTTDGMRMAHLTLGIDFPQGEFVLSGDGCKDFADRHYNGEQLEVIQDTKGPGSFKIGNVTLPLLNVDYPDYSQVIPEDFETTAELEIKHWIKPVRANSASHTAGIAISAQGCRIYFQSAGGETTNFADVPAQSVLGPEQKVAFNLEYLRRGLTSCKTKENPSATLKVGDHPSGKAKILLLETADYWHMLAPKAGFPHEMSLSSAEMEVLKWAEEALVAVRKGEVNGRVMFGGGKFYLEIGEMPKTEVMTVEPFLQGEEEKVEAAAA